MRADTGTGWPLVVAVTLLCLIALLSVNAWSGNNALIDRFSMSSAGAPSDQEKQTNSANHAKKQTQHLIKNERWRVSTSDKPIGSSLGNTRSASFIKPLPSSSTFKNSGDHEAPVFEGQPIRLGSDPLESEPAVSNETSNQDGFIVGQGNVVGNPSAFSMDNQSLVPSSTFDLVKNQETDQSDFLNLTKTPMDASPAIDGANIMSPTTTMIPQPSLETANRQNQLLSSQSLPNVENPGKELAENELTEGKSQPRRENIEVSVPAVMNQPAMLVESRDSNSGIGNHSPTTSNILSERRTKPRYTVELEKPKLDAPGNIQIAEFPNPTPSIFDKDVLGQKKQSSSAGSELKLPERPLKNRQTTITNQSVAPQDQSQNVPQPVVAKTPAKRAPAKDSPTSPTRDARTWPAPTSLLTELKPLTKVQQTGLWAQSTIGLINQLTTNTDLASPSVAKTLTQLYRQIEMVDAIIVQVSTVPVSDMNLAQGDFASSLRRQRYRIHRRLEIWTAVYRLAAAGEKTVSKTQSDAFLTRSTRLDFDRVPQEWVKYLKLESISKTWGSETVDAKKRHAARQILARATSNYLTDEQFKYVGQLLGKELATHLRIIASKNTDLFKFLADVEALEEDSNAVTQIYLNDHFLNLYWSSDPNANYLADVINAHYRNANARVSISERLINRMIPDVPNSNEPVIDRILGATVKGNSTISSQIKVDLVPDDEAWRVRLKTIGWVASRTRAYRDGFTFLNISDASYNATKDIIITPDGPSQAPAHVNASSDQKLVGMYSKYDRIPIVNMLARRIAEQKHAESAPVSKARVENKIRLSTRQRVEAEVQKQLQGVTDQIDKNLIKPLSMLELEPTPIELKTTEDRMILRYRLAGQDQMSANTARPMARRESVISAQVHETCVNNMIAKAHLAGKKFSVEELVTHLNRLFNTDKIKLRDDMPRDVQIEFQKADPIRFDFDDDHVAVTLRIRKFKIGKSTWWNLIVRSHYDVAVRGFDFVLTQRSPGISLDGHRLRMRDQIAMRTVFLQLLGDQYNFSATQLPIAQKINLNGLWISQLVIREGWIGISVNDGSDMTPKAVDDRTVRRMNPFQR